MLDEKQNCICIGKGRIEACSHVNSIHHSIRLERFPGADFRALTLK